MSKKSEQERAEQIERLRELVKPGDTLYTILRHVSSSGMSRVVQVVKMVEGEPLYLGWGVAKAIDATYDTRREGVKVQGCGTDVGFEVVYNLGRVLFPEGGSLEHSPRKWQEERAGETKEKDGGYLLRHRWL